MTREIIERNGGITRYESAVMTRLFDERLWTEAGYTPQVLDIMFSCFLDVVESDTSCKK